MTPAELLALFHREVRLGPVQPSPHLVIERVGPVRRAYHEDPAVPRAMIEAPQGLGPDPDEVITGERDFFAARGQRVEFKVYSYDEPADLPDRLVAAGFVAEDVEALILGEAAAVLAGASPLPPGLRLRDVDGRADFDRIDALHEQVWGDRSEGYVDNLVRETRDHPDRIVVTVVEEVARGRVVSSARLGLEGSSFAGLWGGATLAQWRGQGLYRALVAHRARIALDRGVPYLRVDASADSAPILARLGLHQVATTTPFILDPRHR